MLSAPPRTHLSRSPALQRKGGRSLEGQKLQSLALGRAGPGLPSPAPGDLSSFPQPAGPQPRTCAPLSLGPPHSSAHSGSKMAFRALLGVETQTHTKDSQTQVQPQTHSPREITHILAGSRCSGTNNTHRCNTPTPPEPPRSILTGTCV